MDYSYTQFVRLISSRGVVRPVAQRFAWRQWKKSGVNFSLWFVWFRRRNPMAFSR